MSYSHSMVLIAPSGDWPALTQMANTVGYGLGEGLKLSADGSELETHRGIHAWVRADFAQWISTPPEIEGFDQAVIDAIHARMTISANDTSGGAQVLTNADHFFSVLAQIGLVVVAPPVEG